MWDAVRIITLGGLLGDSMSCFWCFCSMNELRVTVSSNATFHHWLMKTWVFDGTWRSSTDGQKRTSRIYVTSICGSVMLGLGIGPQKLMWTELGAAVQSTKSLSQLFLKSYFLPLFHRSTLKELYEPDFSLQHPFSVYSKTCKVTFDLYLVLFRSPRALRVCWSLSCRAPLLMSRPWESTSFWPSTLPCGTPRTTSASPFPWRWLSSN